MPNLCIDILYTYYTINKTLDDDFISHNSAFIGSVYNTI